MRILNSIVLFSLLLISLGAWAQGYEERVAVLDVLHYDFQIAISDSNDVIQGQADIKFVLKKATDHMALDLVAASGTGKGMKVSAVAEKASGQALDFVHQGELLEIKLGKMYDAGTEFNLAISYSGIPADGLIISKDERDGRSFFGDNWPNRAHHWLPTVDHPREKATVDFIILAPAHYEVVANGTLVDQRVGRNGGQISHWHNAEPLPTKVMVFGAADFAIQNVGDVNGIPVSTWVFEKDETNGFKDYAQGKAILQWYITQVGAYPWAKLANVQSRTRYGGMENASCIFYADNSVTGDGSCEALMAHEIAHQWFGNSASEVEWHHIWLSEGFATYFTHLYFEQVHGQDEFRKRLVEDRRDIVASPVAAKFAVVDKRIQDLNQLLNINSYQKGGWVLHMLRQKLGDDLFFKGVREYYALYKFGNAQSEDLQAVMSKLSAQELGPFFYQWLYRPAFPKVDVVWSWKKSKKEVSFTITQTQSGEPYDFQLDLAAVDAQGAQIGMLTQNVRGKTSKATLALDQMPAKIVLDPQVKLLFEGEVKEK